MASESTSTKIGFPSRDATRAMRASASLVRFEQGDILNADVSGATVVTLYLVSSANLKLRPLLTKQLQPGARDRLARLRHGRLAARQNRSVH